ncbi:MAG: hypothetical protein V7642_686 [Burkholderiales bacterium]
MTECFNRLNLWVGLLAVAGFTTGPGVSARATEQPYLALTTPVVNAHGQSDFARLQVGGTPLRLALTLSQLPSDARWAESPRKVADRIAATEPEPLPLIEEQRPLRGTGAARIPEAADPEQDSPPLSPAPDDPAREPAPTQSVAAAPAPAWEISPADRTLNATLARWATSAGWQLVWELQVDYPVETRATLHGTFDEVVGMVAKSLEGSGVPVQAVFYAGNKVLRLIAKGSK